MTDESDLWTVVDEPSMEDFEAAEEEQPQVGARVLRVVGVLLVILALLLYFVAPFYNFFSSVTYHWLRPNTPLSLLTACRPTADALAGMCNGGVCTR